MVVVVVGIDELSKSLTSLEIIGKGLLLTDSMILEAKTNVVNALNNVDIRKMGDETEMNSFIRRSLKNYIFKVTKKNPMILPIVMEV